MDFILQKENRCRFQFDLYDRIIYRILCVCFVFESLRIEHNYNWYALIFNKILCVIEEKKSREFVAMMVFVCVYVCLWVIIFSLRTKKDYINNNINFIKIRFSLHELIYFFYFYENANKTKFKFLSIKKKLDDIISLPIFHTNWFN